VAAPPGEAARGRLQRLAGAVTYGAYRTASGIARTLPNFAADGFAVPAGLGANLTRPERRAMIERHLRRVDPTLEGWRLRRAVQDAFDSYARYWIETFRLPTLPAKVVSDGFTEEGYAAHIQGGLAAGRGVILALPHLGGWEWAGRWLTDLGHPVTAIVEQLDPPELFDWFVRLRRDLGMTVVPLGPGAGQAVLKALADNEVVCLLCDRNIGAGGVEVEFFGERTLLPAGPATMAIRAGSPLIPVGAYFTPRPNGHHAVIRPPVPTVREGRLRDDVVRVTQDLTYALERLIRRAPSQWHMFLPNWPSDPGYEGDPGRA
jgi:phosphatidylinositol dimannoside acyltransferase